MSALLCLSRPIAKTADRMVMGVTGVQEKVEVTESGVMVLAATGCTTRIHNKDAEAEVMDLVASVPAASKNPYTSASQP